MVKNKTEKMFSKSLRESSLWGMKIESNPLAHQQQPGDYILTFDTMKHWTIIVEAKQVTCDENGKGRFAFKRLKNLIPLRTFDRRSFNHRGYLLLTYNENMWANSDIYLIPINAIGDLIAKWPMVSLNREDAQKEFGKYKHSIQSGSIINIEKILLGYIE